MKWEQDKTKHAVISFLLTVVGYALLGNLLVASIIAITIGILKEVYDKWFSGGKGCGDVNDIIADLIGVLAGALSCYIWWMLCC